MIPNEIPDDARQEEKTIFEILKHGRLAQDRNWRIFHSIQVPQRANPSRSRLIDFVILIPNQLSVICIVVKPPATLGFWDETHGELVTDPNIVENIEDSTEDLNIKNITEDLRSLYQKSHFRDDSPLSLGYAVVSPDLDSEQLTITTPYPDIDIKSGTFDILDTMLEGYAGNLNPKLWEDLDKLYTKDGDFNEEGWNEWRESWDKAQEELLVTLRSDLESLQPDSEGSKISDPTIIHDYDPKTLRSKLLVLTEEQVKSYKEFLQEPRCVIDGAAGTGKTVLAKYLAEQRCEKSETVGLLCSNRYLIDDFEKWAEAVSNNSNGKIIVGTPSTLPSKIFEENNTLSERHEQRVNDDLEQTLRFGFLKHEWQSFIEETVNDLTQVIDNADKTKESGIFDYLIVDEAQNLCDEVFLKLMDVLLKDGLAKGKWAMFGDFIYQNIVTLDRDEGTDVLKKFDEGIDWEEDTLRTNCRNTQEISGAVENLVQIKSLPRSGVHGPHVAIKLFDSLELNKMLQDLISTYSNEGIKSTESILLSSGEANVFNEIVKKYDDQYNEWQLRPIGEGIEDSSAEGNILRYSDVYDYQGLESNFVILVMPETGENVELAGGNVLTRPQHLNRVLYTGMSRAHTMLVILAEKSSYEEILKTRWPNYEW